MDLTDLVKKNRLTVILVGVSLVIIISATYLNRLTKQPSLLEQKNRAIRPQLVGQLSPQDGRLPIYLNKNPKLEATFSAYLKTSIGKTSDQEVAKLNNLKQKQVLPNGSIQYSFNSPLLKTDNLVVTRGGVVVFKRVFPGTDDWDLPRVTDYISQHGNPERELTGSKNWGRFIKTYIYASQGFTFVGNPLSDEVVEIQSYLSMTVDEYITEWGQDIKDYSKEEPAI